MHRNWQHCLQNTVYNYYGQASVRLCVCVSERECCACVCVWWAWWGVFCAVRMLCRFHALRSLNFHALSLALSLCPFLSLSVMLSFASNCLPCAALVLGFSGFCFCLAFLAGFLLFAFMFALHSHFACSMSKQSSPKMVKPLRREKRRWDSPTHIIEIPNKYLQQIYNLP